MTSPNAAVRDARLDFRLNRDHKRLIEQAATVSGQSLSDFAVANLVKAAQQTIDEAMVTRLSLRDSEIFLKLITSDAKPNKALKAAAERYKQRRV
jgi:uncharacterized protein (DUF1778 family)